MPFFTITDLALIQLQGKLRSVVTRLDRVCLDSIGLTRLIRLTRLIILMRMASSMSKIYFNNSNDSLEYRINYSEALSRKFTFKEPFKSLPFNKRFLDFLVFVKILIFLVP